MTEINLGDLLGKLTGIVADTSGNAFANLTPEEKSKLDGFIDILAHCDDMQPRHHNLPRMITVVPREGQNLYFTRDDLPANWYCEDIARFFVLLAKAPRTKQILVGYHMTSSPDIGARWVSRYDNLLELLGSTPYNIPSFFRIYVKDARNKMPISGAVVSIEGVPQTTRGDGSAKFYLPGAGWYIVRVRADGYAPYEDRLYLPNDTEVDLSPPYTGGQFPPTSGGNQLPPERQKQTSTKKSNIRNIALLGGLALLIFFLAKRK